MVSPDRPLALISIPKASKVSRIGIEFVSKPGVRRSELSRLFGFAPYSRRICQEWNTKITGDQLRSGGLGFMILKNVQRVCHKHRPSRTCTILWFDRAHARWSGDMFLTMVAFLLASHPASNRSLTKSIFSMLTARCRGLDLWKMTEFAAHVQSISNTSDFSFNKEHGSGRRQSGSNRWQGEGAVGLLHKFCCRKSDWKQYDRQSGTNSQCILPFQTGSTVYQHPENVHVFLPNGLTNRFHLQIERRRQRLLVDVHAFVNQPLAFCFISLKITHIFEFNNGLKPQFACRPLPCWTCLLNKILDGAGFCRPRSWMKRMSRETQHNNSVRATTLQIAVISSPGPPVSDTCIDNSDNIAKTSQCLRGR